MPLLAAHDRVIVSFFYKFTDPDSDNKSYELTTVDGTATSENHVFFYREWASSLTRLQKASQLKRAFKEEQADIDHSYGRQLIRWRADRRDWELRLVFYVWDRGLARFPPYDIPHDQLGDKVITIPEERSETPPWRPAASMLKGSSLPCARRTDCLPTSSRTSIAMLHALASTTRL